MPKPQLSRYPLKPNQHEHMIFYSGNHGSNNQDVARLLKFMSTVIGLEQDATVEAVSVFSTDTEGATWSASVLFAKGEQT